MIGFAAMADTENLNDIASGAGEEEPVIADPRPQFFPLTLQSLDISCARFRESMQGVQNTHGSGLVQTANVGLSLFSSGDPLHAGSL